MDYTIYSHITPKVFQEFAWFDILRQQRRWQTPALFTLLMSVFAAVCFLAPERVRGAGLLGWVLLAVGLLLPLGWLLSFHLSVRAETKRLKLSQAPVAYTLRLTDQGLSVSNDREQADFSWDQLHSACRLQHCVCLYTAPRQAFLLPDADLPEKPSFWQDICRFLPPNKVRDLT